MSNGAFHACCTYFYRLPSSFSGFIYQNSRRFSRKFELIACISTIISYRIKKSVHTHIRRILNAIHIFNINVNCANAIFSYIDWLYSASKQTCTCACKHTELHIFIIIVSVLCVENALNGPLKNCSTQITWKMRLLCEFKCIFNGFAFQL